jgi:hypothetical protein
MTEANKVTILLHEYDTLRDEIVQRMSARQQQISVGVIVFIGLLTILLANNISATGQFILYGVMTLSLFVFWYAMSATNHVILRAAWRLREIERSVNRRAGEPILQWETYWGGAIVGWGKWEPLPGRPRDEDTN